MIHQQVCCLVSHYSITRGAGRSLFPKLKRGAGEHHRSITTEAKCVVEWQVLIMICVVTQGLEAACEYLAYVGRIALVLSPETSSLSLSPPDSLHT